MNKMYRMKMGILFSESVLNPVHPVHPVRLFLVAVAALGACGWFDATRLQGRISHFGLICLIVIVILLFIRMQEGEEIKLRLRLRLGARLGGEPKDLKCTPNLQDADVFPLHAGVARAECPRATKPLRMR